MKAVIKFHGADGSWLSVIRDQFKQHDKESYQGFVVSCDCIIAYVERYLYTAILGNFAHVDKITVEFRPDAPLGDKIIKEYKVKYVKMINGEPYESATESSEYFIFNRILDNVVLFEEDVK